METTEVSRVLETDSDSYVKANEVLFCMPSCFTWSEMQVGNWIETVGYPCYRDCFTTNFITGRRLILMEASALEKIGINDFVHVKEIAKAIRNLLQIDGFQQRNRDISLPPKGEKELFLVQKSMTGINSDKLTFDKFHDDWEYLKFEPPLCNQTRKLARDKTST